MSDLTIAVLSAVFTIFGALIIFLFKDAIENLFIFPKRRFKKKLIEVKANLLFYKNLLTNAFNRAEINDIFFEKIFRCQEKLRKNWVGISITYPAIIRIPIISKEPSKEQIKKIQGNLLFLSNSALVYFEKNQPHDISSACTARQEKIDEILSIIDRCV